MILGVDPGRDKTGWALIRREGELALSGIVPASGAELFSEAWSRPVGEWEEALAAWTCERRFSVSRSGDEPGLEYIALGDGTGSREMARQLCRLNVEIVLVDEKRTTLEARERYWILHRPALWQRCLPRRLRIPPRAVDDLAAWAIALRSLKNLENLGNNSEPASDSDFEGIPGSP
jgi:RNase H-fold protein (predicted Holliday junction resolvase)